MATLFQLLSAMQKQVQIVTSNLPGPLGDILNAQVGVFWPPIDTLQQLTKMEPQGAIVSIYDRKSGHDSTRWIPSVVAQTTTAALLASSPQSQIVLPGASGTLTLSGGEASGDAVSLLVGNRSSTTVPDPGDGVYTWSPTAAVVYSTKAGDDPTSSAAGLAALAAADPLMSTWVSCTVSGSTLTIQNLLPTVVTVTSFTGNGGVNILELARRKREVQVTVWAPSPEIRNIVSDPIEVLITQMEMFTTQFPAGLVLPDGSFARIEHYNDFLIDDPMLADLYRRDTILCADYPITTQDQLWSVLAPVTQYQITT